LVTGAQRTTASVSGRVAARCAPTSPLAEAQDADAAAVDLGQDLQIVEGVDGIRDLA